jgi:hypothetical protein
MNGALVSLLGQSKDNNTFKETRHILPLSLHTSTHLRAE